MTVITLLTDFGLQDGYPGVMKGVIWRIAPKVNIADISHSIKPQDISQGAIALERTAWYFPPGTIHVAVVDPGVGTDRKSIGMRLGEYCFIGPDNGIFTRVYNHAESHEFSIELVHLNQNKYWLPQISRVFHGRDIFAPVAAHLACGIPLKKLGTPIKELILLEIRPPEQIHAGGIRGKIIEIDNFGNLSTNIEQAHLISLGNVYFQIADHQINGLVDTFGERPPGTLIALYGTSQDLIISIVNGNAAKFLNASVGDPIEVYPAK